VIVFIRKLLRLCRPYRQRLILGILMGLLGGLMEPLFVYSIKVAVDVAFPGAGGIWSTLPSYSADTIEDLPKFAVRLKEHSDPLSAYLWNRFWPATQQELLGYVETNSPPRMLGELVSRELSLIILDPKLYDPDRFAGVQLPLEVKQLLAQQPKDSDLIRLNRLLLDSAYPGELATAQLSFLDKHPWLRKQLTRLSQWVPTGASTTRATNILLVIIALPLVMLLRGLVSYLNVYFLQWVAVRAITDLRTKLFSHLMNLPLAFLSKVSTGELLSRVTNDTMAVQNAIGNSLIVLIKDPATLVGLAAFLLYNQPMLTLVSMVVFPICLVPIVIYARKVRQSSRAIQTEYAKLGKIMHESFTGNRIIKAYNLERNVVAQFQEASGRFIGHYMRAVRAGEMPGPLIEFCGAVGLSGLFYYILLISHRHISAGDFFGFVIGVFSMYKPIKSISRLYNQLEQANASSERVFELLETKSTLPEPAKPLLLLAAGKDIQFDHITFYYDEKPVLADFNLTVKAGQMVALVGKTGSGKTTVTNLLLRFYDPQKGAVRIGGTDIRDVATPDLRNQIAVVTQETLLFDETIRRNIELGRPGATETEIVAAAKHAHAHDFIVEKPQGYDTMIGEKGVTLSGGQKQRLAIARAIVKNAPILVLDEATSSLDTQTERAVQTAFDELMRGRTTICIAHRLSTIQRADLIVVLDKGHIVETGRHDDLLALDGFYRRLHEMDMKPEPPEDPE